MKIASRADASRGTRRPGPEPTITGRTPAAAAARSSTSSPFSGASRATLRTATSSLSSPSAARSSGAWPQGGRLARSRLRRRSCSQRRARARDRRRARRRTPARASRRRARRPPPRTIGGTAVVFTSRRQPAFGPASWLSTSSTYGTRRRRHQAIDGLRGERAPARDDDDVRPRVDERAEDRQRDRVVVAEHLARARNIHAAEEDRRMVDLDLPAAGGDRLGRVDHRQVDLGKRRNPVEQRRAVRRRLGRDERDPHRFPSFHASLRTVSRQRSGAPRLRRSFPPRRTWLASWSVYRRLLPPASSRFRAASSP